MHQTSSVKKRQDEADAAKFRYISKILSDMNGFNSHSHVWPAGFDPTYHHATWYGSPIYYNHPHLVHAAFTAASAAAAAAAAAATAAATADCYEPPRCKRRKMTNPVSDPIDPDEMTRVSSRRGPVTFRPYSDDLIEPGMRSIGLRGYRKGRHGMGGDGDGRTPGAKRKLGIGRETKATVGRDRELTAQSNVDDDSDNDKTTIGNLFPEILEMIFGQLDIRTKGRAARVSMRPHDVNNIYKEEYKRLWNGGQGRGLL